MKTAMPEHIIKLFNEARDVKFNSVDYWKLRCTYREKMDDMTYSEHERNNCYNLWANTRKKKRMKCIIFQFTAFSLPYRWLSPHAILHVPLPESFNHVRNRIRLVFTGWRVVGNTFGSCWGL